MARAGGLRPVRTRAPDGNTHKSRRELSVSGGVGGKRMRYGCCPGVAGERRSPFWCPRTVTAVQGWCWGPWSPVKMGTSPRGDTGVLGGDLALVRQTEFVK